MIRNPQKSTVLTAIPVLGEITPAFSHCPNDLSMGRGATVRVGFMSMKLLTIIALTSVLSIGN
jgi:hypothetical protein